MYRFLMRPAWALGLVLCIAAAVAMVFLSRWQWHRLEDKRATNDAIVAARTAPVTSYADLLPESAARNPRPADEWRRVSVTGRYVVDSTVLQRGRTTDDGVGFEVLVPLRTADGAVVLVDRGWVEAPPEADRVPKVPAAPGGEVTVVGRIRLATTTGGSASDLLRIQGTPTVRAIDTGRLAGQMSLPLRGGYVAAVEETPRAAAIARADLPDLDEGPHLAYAAQWLLFAVMTLGAYVFFARREVAERRLASERGEALDVNPMDEFRPTDPRDLRPSSPDPRLEPATHGATHGATRSATRSATPKEPPA